MVERRSENPNQEKGKHETNEHLVLKTITLSSHNKTVKQVFDVKRREKKLSGANTVTVRTLTGR